MAKHSSRRTALTVSIALGIASGIASGVAAAAAPKLAGDYYESTGTAVSQFTSNGTLVRTVGTTGGEARGIAFGPDGLYVVQSNAFTPSVVQVLDTNGVVTRTYAFAGWTGGLVTSGDIRFSPKKDVFYVSAQDGVYRFPVQGTQGTKFIDRSTVDLAVMPNGDLLVAGDYDVTRYTADGTFVGTFTNIQDPLGLAPPNAWLVDVRGIAYDPRTDTTFVTMLGYTGFYDQLLAFKGTSAELKGLTTYWYGNEMAVTADGRLLVGSWTQPAGIFAVADAVPMTFTQQGTLGSADAVFVTSRKPVR